MNYAKIRRNPDTPAYMLRVAYRKLNSRLATNKLVINQLVKSVNSPIGINKAFDYIKSKK